MPDLPGPRSAFFGLPLSRSLQRDRLGTLARLARDYGDIVAFRVGPQRLVLLNHPDYVEDVLVTRARVFKKGRALERAKRLLGEGLLTSEADLHRRQRRLAQPAFHKQRIAAYADAMVAHAERTAARWADGETLDISAEMNRLTLTIVGETLLGSDLEAEAGAVARGADDGLRGVPDDDVSVCAAPRAAAAADRPPLQARAGDARPPDLPDHRRAAPDAG